MESKKLLISEIFTSIQGESTLQGIPTTFIRLSGCPLRCSWCDTSYAFKKGKKIGIDKILKNVEELGLKNVCITGGEPLIQKEVYELLGKLLVSKKKVSLETSGSISIEKVDPRVKVILDVKCPGSGMEKHNFWPNLSLLRAGDETKFVIADLVDYNFAKEICSKYGLFAKENRILFSLSFGQLNPQELVKWILKDRLEVRLNLQIHKMIWPAHKKGV